MKNNEFFELLNTAFSENAISHLLNQTISEQLFVLTDLLLTENEKYNLTAINTVSGVVYKHIIDSLLISAFIPSGVKIIDIGCGAGFPSLPLSIARPDIFVTSLDSSTKKIGFISKCIRELSLNNISTVASRAEDAARASHREIYDLSVARAVSSLHVLSELCTPFLKTGGRFIAMKGPDGLTEFNSSLAFLSPLKSGKPNIMTYDLHIGSQNEARSLITIEKLGKTPDNIPRNYAQIINKPLA